MILLLTSLPLWTNFTPPSRNRLRRRKNNYTMITIPFIFNSKFQSNLIDCVNRNIGPVGSSRY